MNFFLNVEEQSRSLIKDIGSLKIDDNSNLRDLFVYKNINIWEVYEPILAIYILPQIISKKRRLFYKYLYLFSNVFRIFLSSSFKNEEYSKNDFWLFPCFSNYMYKDTILPLVQFCKKNNTDFEYIIIGNTAKHKFSFGTIFFLMTFISRIKNAIVNSEIKSMDIIGISSKDINFLINYLLYNLIPKNIMNIEDALNRFNFKPPEVVISIDVANPASRIYTVLAKRYNVLSVDLQYGHYEPTDIEWCFSISDKIFVWGQFYLDLFEKNFCLSRDKLEITGSPKFDYLMDKSYFQESKDSKYKIKILFASTYTISSYENIENYEVIKKFKNNLVKEIQNLSNLELVIKPHPLEDISWLSKIELSKNILVSDKRCDIKKLISNCDYFISFGSTTAFDALLLDKVCFSVNYLNTKKNQDVFVNSNMVNLINDDMDLNRILELISSNLFQEPLDITESRNRFLKTAILSFNNLLPESSCGLIFSYVLGYMSESKSVYE